MEHKFYDLNASVNIENLLERAELLGLTGICPVINSNENLEKYLTKIRELRKKTDLDLITGVLIQEDQNNILKKAKELRRKVEVILVSGGNYEVNRLACSSDYVDILCHPEKGRHDSGLDHICCREAKIHNTIIELNFRELLLSEGMERIKELNKMKEILRLCLRFKTRFIVNSGARELYELRSGKELSSLSFCLGAEMYDALSANSELPEKLIFKNREKMKQPLDSVYIEYGK